MNTYDQAQAIATDKNHPLHFNAIEFLEAYHNYEQSIEDNDNPFCPAVAAQTELVEAFEELLKQ